MPGGCQVYRPCKYVSKLMCPRVKTQVSSETRTESGNVTVSLVDEGSNIYGSEVTAHNYASGDA